MYKMNKDIVIKKRESIYLGIDMDKGTFYEMNDTQYDIINFFNTNEYKSEIELIEYLKNNYIIPNEDEFLNDIKFSLGNLVDNNVLLIKA